MEKRNIYFWWWYISSHNVISIYGWTNNCRNRWNFYFKNPIISTTQFTELQQSHPNIVGYPSDNKNTKVSAGWLIDQCGWKGYREKDAGVHKNQALVLVNYGNASGGEIISLSQKIQSSVNDKFGVQIHPEVNIIGWIKVRNLKIN